LNLICISVSRGLGSIIREIRKDRGTLDKLGVGIDNGDDLLNKIPVIFLKTSYLSIIVFNWRFSRGRSSVPEYPHISIKIPVCDKISHADDILPVNILNGEGRSPGEYLWRHLLVPGYSVGLHP